MIKLKCPNCQKSVAYHEDNPSRPFCSARCKLIDLGSWASESYSISSPLDEEAIMSLEEKDLDT